MRPPLERKFEAWVFTRPSREGTGTNPRPVILAAAARRVGAPYPVFLALGGALLAFAPGTPSFTIPPDLALALFVAPVLLDAAYATSLRDLRDNWAPITR